MTLTREHTGKVHWNLLKWVELAEDLRRIKTHAIFFPVGSVEQHGPHLPLGLDYIIADEVSSRVCRKLQARGILALKLPPLPFGMSSMWGAYPGTITLSTETLYGAVRDVLHSLWKSGIRLVVIVNGHAGNADLLRVVARDSAEEFEGLTVAVVTVWEIVGDLIKELFQTPFFHADEVETSVALALNLPVGEPPRSAPQPSEFRMYSEEWHSLDLTTRPKAYVYSKESSRVVGLGAFGSPSLATKDKGLKLLEGMESRIVKFVTDLLHGLERKMI